MIIAASTYVIKVRKCKQKGVFVIKLVKYIMNCHYYRYIPYSWHLLYARFELQLTKVLKVIRSKMGLIHLPNPNNVGMWLQTRNAARTENTIFNCLLFHIQ